MKIARLRELSADDPGSWYSQEAAVRHFGALVSVAECVPGLIDWMERYRGGDESLPPEEFYVRIEAAQRAIGHLESQE